MKLYLANSAFKSDNFDFLKTIEAAAAHGFHGAQLYLDEGKRGDERLLKKAAALAKQLRMEIVAHLPDDAGKRYGPPLLTLLRFQADRRAVIHFIPGRPAPGLERVAIGLENCIRGFDPAYFDEWLRAAKQRRTFLAFDAPRLFSGEPAKGACDDAARMLSRLGERDFLHLVDLRGWGSGRKDWVPLGKGLLAPLMPRFKSFGGGVVLEYEDLGLALASREALAGVLPGS